jgi:hypothetical protein
MKTLLAFIVVIAFARLILGLVMMIVNLPFGIVLEQWGDKSPHVMEGLRLRIRATAFFIALFIGVVVTVIFSFYIFHVLARAPVGIVFPMAAVTIPMLFSIRADIRDWKLQYANAWNKESDVSDEFRRRLDSEMITIHRVGVFAKTCAVVAAWIYFGIIGDQVILPYIGIK